MKLVETLDRRLLIVATSGLGMIAYIYLTPPFSQTGYPTGYLILLLTRQDISTEMAVYIQRFAVAFFCLGMLPFCAARLCGYGLADLGWRRIEWNGSAWWLAAVAAAGVLLGGVSALSEALRAYYPYSPTLVAGSAEYGPVPFLVHAVSYVVLYYLPWETMFRGVLIFPFIHEMRDKGDAKSRVILIASMQAIPSALLHFGHPASETISALAFGIAAAIVTVKTRSVLPVFVFHAAVGLGLDAAIVLGGV